MELSGSSTGSGASFTFPAALALDPSQQRALLVANMEGWASLGAIDLATGARSVISGGSSSAHLLEASDTTFDPAANRVCVTRGDFSSPTCNVIRIDAASGSLSPVGDSSTGKARGLDFAARRQPGRRPTPGPGSCRRRS